MASLLVLPSWRPWPGNIARLLSSVLTYPPCVNSRNKMPKRGIEAYFSKKPKKPRQDHDSLEGDEAVTPASQSDEQGSLPVGEFKVSNPALVAAANATAAHESHENNLKTDAQTSEQEVEENGSGEKMDIQEARIIAANRNSAKARQVVVTASKDGGQPKLEDLLVCESWRGHLKGEFDLQYMKSLQSFLAKEWSGAQVFPPPYDIFRALNTVPFDGVRVVIIGQDPYHGVNQAMGMSFSVPKSVQTPSSLKNIYKEILSDVGGSRPNHGDLTKWALQGVLLLNAVLTVQAHKANSHAKKGWEKFTDAIIQKLNSKRTGLVFLLWGKHAKEKGKHVNRSKHFVLETVHPSGLSANRGFFGCKHFSKANVHLVQQGLEAIDWQIE